MYLLLRATAFTSTKGGAVERCLPTGASPGAGFINYSHILSIHGTL
jgi:hypothetical protein